MILWIDGVSELFLMQALDKGVRGVLSMTSSIDHHIECFRHIARGDIWLDRAIRNQLQSTRAVRLTPREQQFMGLIAQGLSNKELAWSLGIAEGTVKVYLSNLFAKLRVNGRFELALVALRNTYAGVTFCGVSPRSSNTDRVAPLEIPPLIYVNAVDAFSDNSGKRFIRYPRGLVHFGTLAADRQSGRS
jgi:DNA-binding CsgD family transcriptional regulator